eukprot:CAMPEP_0170180376 /NCGR_PEP_ID=MMETSP0040_2-20121228/21808_1 /TAXON_ID=641309 /ORGANISM="Lotharella oceanica, Strain CCMP622" /LENGTH=123 /DNA_ID=CAMNT_0010424993 /DNA_START=119 /DNA_END=490 /DNA_ORIENTATION=+
MTYDFTKENNPLFLARPRWLQIATCISAYGYAPFYAFFALCFLFKLNVIRLPALVFLGIKLNALVFYHIMEFTSDMPPPNLGAYWGVEGPYLLSIALILLRTVPGPPFETSASALEPNKEKTN